MKEKINIAIAEDHDIVREGLVALLKDHPLISVLFDSSNGKELCDQLRIAKPHIIILDLEMPVMSGKEAFEKIKQKYPKIKIVIISATFNDSVIIDYLKKGASSFLYKNCKFDKLVNAIVTVHEQGVYYDEEVSKILAKEISLPAETLSKTEFSELEINILKLIRDGLTSKEIGERLFLNNRTVEWHRSQMIKRTHTKNAPDLIAFGIKHGFL